MPRSLRVGGRSSKQKPKHARRLFVSVDEAANRSRDSEVAAVFFAAALCSASFELKEAQPRVARHRRRGRTGTGQIHDIPTHFLCTFWGVEFYNLHSLQLRKAATQSLDPEHQA